MLANFNPVICIGAKLNCSQLKELEASLPFSWQLRSLVHFPDGATAPLSPSARPQRGAVGRSVCAYTQMNTYNTLGDSGEAKQRDIKNLYTAFQGFRLSNPGPGSRAQP